MVKKNDEQENKRGLVDGFSEAITGIRLILVKIDMLVSLLTELVAESRKTKKG